METAEKNLVTISIQYNIGSLSFIRKKKRKITYERENLTETQNNYISMLFKYYLNQRGIEIGTILLYFSLKKLEKI